jgi:putative ABC transport system permease protein
MNVWLPMARYEDDRSQAAFFDRLVERVEALPGVEAAGGTNVLPVSKNFDQRRIEIEGRVYGPGERPSTDTYFVTPDYTRALAIPVLSGRALERTDTADAPLVALVSESMAREMWPGEDALGKRFRVEVDEGAPPPPWRTVVGIVSDVRQKALDAGPKPALYLPEAQFPNSDLTLVVRGSGDLGALATAVRHEVLAIDKDQDVFDVETMSEVLAASIAVRRFAMLLLGAFAAVALALAAVGIYGVLSYAVSQRTQEIGVRLALGARGTDIVRLVAGHGVRLAVLGVAIGLCGAYAATRGLASLLFGVTATDPVTFAATAGLLVGVATLASVIPALRAARTDPLRALRTE